MFAAGSAGLGGEQFDIDTEEKAEMLHTVFLVHGMGAHANTDWADSVWQKILECSERYPHFKNTRPLSEYARFVAIDYDEYIERALARWRNNGNTFAAFAMQHGFVNASDFQGLQEVRHDDTEFLFSHIADVLIYRYFGNERAQIIETVMSKIAGVIHDGRNADAEAEFSVVAHSLGTAVAHDALHRLGSEQMIGGNQNTLRGLQFDSVHMIANVSRVLQDQVNAYESVVRPRTREFKGGICQVMHTYRHKVDPFANVRKFQPVTWGDSHNLVPVDHVHGWNIHGWLHYLDDPRVHIPILKRIAKNSAIKRPAEIEAVDNYPQFGGNLEGVETANQELSRLAAVLQNVDDDRGLKENFETIRESFEILSRLKDLTNESWDTLEIG